MKILFEFVRRILFNENKECFAFVFIKNENVK
jgi:hypothetical protein